MIIAAIVIGVLSAYYLGLKAGGVAAVVSFILFFVGLMMPGKLLWVYGIIAIYIILVLFIGPRLPGQKGKKADFMRLFKGVFKHSMKFIGKYLK